MPTYDYKCLECNYTFEEFQKMTDEPLDTCPNCQGEVKRLIGAGAAPIFKGSGFYQTDYKNKPADKKTSNEKSSAASKTSTSPAKSTETKK